MQCTVRTYHRQRPSRNPFQSPREDVGHGSDLSDGQGHEGCTGTRRRRVSGRHPRPCHHAAGLTKHQDWLWCFAPRKQISTKLSTCYGSSSRPVLLNTLSLLLIKGAVYEKLCYINCLRLISIWHQALQYNFPSDGQTPLPRAGAQVFKQLFGGAAWRNQDLPKEDGTVVCGMVGLGPDAFANALASMPRTNQWRSQAELFLTWPILQSRHHACHIWRTISEQLSYHYIEGYGSVMWLLKEPPHQPPSPPPQTTPHPRPTGPFRAGWGKKFVD